MVKVSLADVERVFLDFYNLTHFKIVLFDSERNVITSYPKNMCRFCSEVRRIDALAHKCKMCDERGFDVCDKTRKPYIYKCHLGAVEAIAPIYAADVNAGYLMFGQIRSGNRADIVNLANRANSLYGTALTENLIDEMTEAEESFINSAVNMMTLCASYLYANEIIRANPNILADQLRDYVRENLDTELNLSTICQHFYISRTKLYQLSKQFFGIGISDYIRKERVKEAKRLLTEKTLSISEVAARVGIPDYNYFIRMFKASEGITPLKYKKIEEHRLFH